MSIDDLWQMLVSAGYLDTTDLTFDLPAANSLGSAEITALLGDAAIFGKHRLGLCKLAAPSRSSTSIVLAGELSAKVLNLPPVNATLTFVIEAGTAQMLLQLQLPTDWTFASTFSNLEHSNLGAVTFSAASLWAASLPLQAGSQVYPQGLSFSGQPDFGTPAMIALAALVPDGQSTLFGPVVARLSGTGLYGSLQLDSQTTPLSIAGIKVPGQVTLHMTADGTAPTLSASLLLPAGSALGTLKLQGTLIDGSAGIQLSLDSEINLNDSLGTLSALFSGQSPATAVPADVPLGNNIKISALTLDTAGSMLSNLSLTIELDSGENAWSLLGGMLELQRLGLSLQLLLLDSAELSITLFGDFSIEEGHFSASVSLPDLALEARLIEGSVSLSAVLARFTRNQVASPSANLSLSYLEMHAQPQLNVYGFSGTLDGNLSLGTLQDGGPALAVESLSWDLQNSTTGLAVDLHGSLSLLGVQLELDASRPAAGDWSFRGRMPQPVALREVVKDLLPSGFGVEPPDVRLRTFDFQTTPARSTFALNAAIEWALSLNDVDYQLSAALQLQSSRASPELPAQYTGQIGASLGFSGLTLGVLFAFTPNNKVITFSYQRLQVIYDNNPADPTLSIQFGDTSLGDLVQFFYTLANQGRRTQLPAPWNVLDDIRFNNLSIQVHLKTKAVKVDYPIDLELGFLTLKRIGFAYTRQYGRAQLPIMLEGQFLGQSFGGNDPLQWDLMNQPPPSVPGVGGAAFDLSYLAIGQRLGFTQPPGTSVEQIIKGMRGALKPPQGPAANPVAAQPGLQYDASAGWVFGLQMQALKALSLSVVFADPAVYGMHIALSGENAKSLAGLSLEVLYRKIGPNLGQYHVDFKVPTAYRTLQLGAVSVTLAELVLDIYTNGNFKINAGYPPSLTDWSRSFALEVFPFLGFGGFYFGLLDGQTSTNVPVISNGTFHPVLEFGLALSIGVGKSISLGPLSGGITLTVVGAVQGTLAWFHPTDSNLPQAMFYRLDGTVGILGKVWGSVDFVIIQASVDLTVSAFVSLEVESHQPILISMQAGVSVHVSVKVLFIRIHFSFSATISESFSIGSASPTPWLIAQDPRSARFGVAPHEHGLSARHRLERLAATLEGRSVKAPAAGLHGRRPLPGQSLYRSLARATGPQADGAMLRALHPASRLGRNGAGMREFGLLSRPFAARSLRLRAVRPLRGPADAPPPLTLYTLVMVSQARADDLNVQTTQETQAALSVMLGIQTSADSSASSLLGTLRRGDSEQLNTPSDFDRLARALLGDVLASVAASESTTIIELLDLKAELDDPDTVRQQFSYTMLKSYLQATGLTFDVVPRPDNIDAGEELSIGFFPMIPDLIMTVNDVTVDFQQKAHVDRRYEAALQDWFSKLKPHAPGQANQSLASADSESFAQFLFRMYFVTLLKQLVQASIDQFSTWTEHVTAPATTSLNELASRFTSVELIFEARQGDSLADICALFGTPLGALEVANPTISPSARLAAGTPINVPFQVTALSIAAANQDTPGILAQGQTVSLADVIATVAQGDTLAAIAERFELAPSTLLEANQDASGLWLAGATFNLSDLDIRIRIGDTLQSLLGHWAPPGTSGGDFTALTTLELSPGQSLTLPGDYRRHVTVAGDTGASLAQSAGAPDPKAFITALMAANTSLLVAETLATGAPQHLTFANLPVTVPTQGFVLTYVTQANDSIASIANHFYPEHAGDDQQLAPIIARIRTLNPTVVEPLNAGIQLLIPYTTTARHLAIHFNVDLQTLAQAFSAQLGLLAPLALLDVPMFTASIKAGDTFALLARRYNLSLEELIDSLASQAGYLAATGLVIPHVPAVERERLLDALGVAGAYTAAANAASRYFLGGLRVPTPEHPDGSVTRPVLALSGQTLAAPVEASGVAIGLAGSFPNLQFNGSDTPLSFNLGSEELAQIADFATQTFDDGVLWQLPMPAFAYVPSAYALRTALLWQAAVLPAAVQAAELTGYPTLWQLPSVVVAQAQGGAAPLYEVLERTSLPHGGSCSNPVCASFCSLLAIQLRRPPESAGAVLPGTYLMVGADQQGAQHLTALLDHLQAGADSAVLYLLHPPGQAGSNGAGLASDDLNTQASMLLRVNLSTMATAPVSQAYALDDENPPAASLADAPGFLRLLRDASMVHGGGYYLRYNQLDSDAGLPDTLFDASGTATVQLLVLLDSQLPAHPQRVLPGNTHVAIWSNLDTRASHLTLQAPSRQVGSGDTFGSLAASLAPYVASPQDLAVANQDLPGLLAPGLLNVGNGASTVVTPADTLAGVATRLGLTPGDFGRAPLAEQGELLKYGAFVQAVPGVLAAQPNLDTGTVGFLLGRKAPATNSLSDQLATLFQLLGFELEHDGEINPQGVPVGPVVDDIDGSNTLNTPTLWQYRSLLDMVAFGTSAGAPEIEGLPNAKADPYRAVGQTASISQTYLDVLGNRPAIGSAPPAMRLAVPCSDPLLGLARWPSVSTAYCVQEGPLLRLEMDFSPSRYLLGADTSTASGLEAAASDRDRYARIWYQVWQSGLSITPALSIGTLAASDGGDAELVARLALRDLAGAAYTYTAAVATANTVTAKTVEGDALGSIAARWSVDLTGLLAANANVELPALYGAQNPLQLPRFHSVLPGDSANSIQSNTGVTLAQMASWNADAPLAAGLLLARPGTSLTVSAGKSLQDLANALQTTLADSNGVHGLATTSSGLVLTPGLNVQYQSHTLVTDPSTLCTLADLATAFQRLLASTDSSSSVSAADVAVANQYLPDLFKAGQDIVSTAWQVPADTDLSVAAGYLFPDAADGPAQLISLNASLASLFPASTPLIVGTTPYSLQSGDTFALLEQRFGVTAAQLARANAKAPEMVADQTLIMPGMITLPGTAVTAYAVDASDTLQTIAGRFVNLSTGALLLANQSLPGLFQAGELVQGYACKASDSPLDVAQALGLELNALTGLIQASTELLRKGASLYVPAAQVDAGDTLGDAVSRWLAHASSQPMGRDGAMALFGAANATLSGLIAGDQPVAGPGATAIISGAHETFASLAARLMAAAKDLVIQPADVARCNPGLKLQAGPVLLPVVPVLIDCRPSVSLTSAQMPLEVSLTFTRSGNVPDALGQSDVARITSTIRADVQDSSDQGLALSAFAQDFEQSLPGLKLAKGPALRADEPAALWVVNFGYQSATLPSYSVNPLPEAAFYSLPPLSRVAWSAQDIEVPVYEPGQGIKATQSHSFLDESPDDWMTALLSCIDSTLSLNAALQAWDIDPVATQRLLDAKQALADGLAKRTDAILQQRTGDPGKAAEAMRQLMLDQLGSATAVQTLLQMPFKVSSPQTGGPRVALSANLKPQLPSTANATCFGGLAAELGLDTAYLVRMLAEQPYLMCAGTIIENDSGEQHVIARTDTPLSVVTALGRELDAIVNGAVKTQGGASWFAAHTPINVTHSRYTLIETTPASFTDIARGLGTSLSTLLKANATTLDLFAVDSMLRLPGWRELKVAAEDTPATLAATLGMQDDLVQFAEAVAIADLQGPANSYRTGTGTLALLQLLPAFALSASRVELANGTQHATFALTVKEPQDTRQLSLNLQAVISALAMFQEDNSDVEVAQWLTLLCPLVLDLGQVQVPVPMRQLPTPPTLHAQSAGYQPSQSNLIPTWSYTADFGLQLAAQDEVALTLQLSSESASVSAHATLADQADWEGVFQALGGFALVQATLQADLAVLRQAHPTSTTVMAAVSALATLAEAVVRAWPTGNAQRRLFTSALQSFDYTLIPYPSMSDPTVFEQLALHQTRGEPLFIFSVPALTREDLDALNARALPDVVRSAFVAAGISLAGVLSLSSMEQDQRWLLIDLGTEQADPASYTLSLVDSQSGRLEVALTYLWPSLEHDDGRRVASLYRRPALTAQAGNGTSLLGDTLYFPYTAQINQPSSLRLQFSRLDVFAQQQGMSCITVIRNADLGPSTTTVNPRFVYVTPTLAFADSVTPFIDLTQPVDLPRTSLSEALTAQLESLFDRLAQADPTASRYLEAEMLGRYPIGKSGMAGTFPAGALPVVECAIGSHAPGIPLPDLGNNLAKLCQAGWAAVGLPPEAQVVLRLKVFAHTPQGIGQPLLRADKLNWSGTPSL